MVAIDAGALVTRDRERARSFANRNSASTSKTATTGSVGVTNAGDSYTISVGVGIPPTYCRSSYLRSFRVSYTPL
jgi:hypothetical protein